MTLRIIGDVHGQIEPDDVLSRHSRPYLEIIAGVPYSVQVGDMGDGETYRQLATHVDPGRHRFFPGNHDHHDRLPPHSLGDFGPLCWAGVDCFFVRGAASSDRDKLVRIRERSSTRRGRTTFSSGCWSGTRLGYGSSGIITTTGDTGREKPSSCASASCPMSISTRPAAS